MANVVLCVGGGIAAYKAPELVRAFVKRGHEVQVLMTRAAASFVTELSLATVSRRGVRTSLLDVAEEGRVGHIEIADWADLVVVAPGTANLLARARAGLADDVVTAVLLATTAPVLWAPAMNTNMWHHAATRENVRVLAERGAAFVGPDAGDLACGWIGEGRMIDPALIVDAAEARLATGAGAWAGRKVVVSAGPTRGYIDPVRFVSNASTGEMGFELAAAARAAGAEVTLVAGPVERATPPGVTRVDVETAGEMLEVIEGVLDRGGIDLVAMVAAVSDLVPDAPSAQKLDKAQVVDALRGMAWREEVDILATLAARHRDETKFLGFAAQTVSGEDPTEVAAALVEAAVDKLARKRPHAVFVNRVGVPGTGFSSPTNAGHLVVENPGGDPIAHASGPPVAKRALAAWILDQVGQHVMPEGRHDGEG